MKKIIALTSLLFGSCSYHLHQTPQNEIQVPSNSSFAAAQATKLIQEIEADYASQWAENIRKMKDTYSRVIKVIDDKEATSFTVVFFKAISLDEDLSKAFRSLSTSSDFLPNTEALKLCYAAEKRMDGVLALIAPFTDSADLRIQLCSKEAEKYFQFQKDLIIAIRNVDYKNLKASDIPSRIPSDVLSLNAKLREQQEELFRSILEYYNHFS